MFDVIHDELIAKVKNEIAFTAYEITKAVRNNGGQVSHYVVKEIVRDWFRYNRYFGFQSKVVNLTDTISTIVYFKEGVDPKDYIDGLKQQITEQQEQIETLELMGKQSKSNLNRLHFTKKLVEKAGFNTGDKVSVEMKPDGIQIVAYTDNFGKKHTIEKSQLLRVRLQNHKIKEYNMYAGEGKLMAVPIPVE